MCYAGKWTQNEEKSIFYPHFFSNNKKNSVFLPNKFRIWHTHKLNFSLSFKVTWLTAISKRFLCFHVTHWLVLSTWRAGRCPFPSSWALQEKYKRWLVNLWMCVWNIKSILLPHGHHMMLGCRILNLIRLYSNYLNTLGRDFVLLLHPLESNFRDFNSNGYKHLAIPKSAEFKTILYPLLPGSPLHTYIFTQLVWTPPFLNWICVPLRHYWGGLSKERLLVCSQKLSSSLIIVIVLFAPSAPICMHPSWAWVTRIDAVFQIMSHQRFV